MPRTNDVIKFAISGGGTVSGRATKIEVAGTTQTGLTILEIVIVRNKIHQTFQVLEDNVEVIAYGDR